LLLVMDRVWITSSLAILTAGYNGHFGKMAKLERVCQFN
jgi:hypothetical protein